MNGLIFFILNVFFAVGLLLLSFSADSKKNSQKKDINKLVNIILFNSAVYAMMALTLAMCLWGPNQMAKLLGKGKRIVTILPDTGERYFSTELFER